MCSVFKNIGWVKTLSLESTFPPASSQYLSDPNFCNVCLDYLSLWKVRQMLASPTIHLPPQFLQSQLVSLDLDCDRMLSQSYLCFLFDVEVQRQQVFLQWMPRLDPVSVIDPVCQALSWKYQAPPTHRLQHTERMHFYNFFFVFLHFT